LLVELGVVPSLDQVTSAATETKDTDAEIQRLLDDLEGKGFHEAEVTLSLDQKVGHVENALISFEKALDSIHRVLATILEKNEFALRVIIDKPRKR